MKSIIFLILVFLQGISLVAQKRSTGLSFDDQAYAAIPITAPLARGDFDNLPSSISLKAYAPTPGNQGQTGTCVAWSSAFHARSIAESIKLNRTNLNEINANVYAPSFVYNQIRKEPGCDKGTFINEALELLATLGVPKYKDLPFDCDKVINERDLAGASIHKIEGYKALFNANDNNKILPVKKSLAEKKPVLIGMLCPDSFFDAHEAWQPKTEEYEKSFGGHAMVTIGYDDKLYGGAFLIMNSWGTEWGNSGFIWIRYTDFNHFVKYAFEMIEKQPEERKLEGSLELLQSDGKSMPLKKVSNALYLTTASYSSGTAFRIYISNNQPAYVYSIGSDLTKKSYTIFPHKENISPFLAYTKSTIPLPDENHYVRMDQQKGKDYLCVLYSATALDIKGLQKQLEIADGNSFFERLKNTLGESLITSNKINYEQEKARFSGSISGNGIVAIIIEIDHQ